MYKSLIRSILFRNSAKYTKDSAKYMYTVCYNFQFLFSVLFSCESEAALQRYKRLPFAAVATAEREIWRCRGGQRSWMVFVGCLILPAKKFGRH